MNTHRGLYRYRVLLQGIASSPGIFQELMDKMLSGIPMTSSFVDDAICSGKDDAQHLSHLRDVFSRMRECNYKLSKDKCSFMCDSVKFLGQIVSADGVRTDPLKVEAIKSMPIPEDVSQVKSFLGLVNFYAKFVPNLATYCEPLNELTRKDVQWVWSSKCQRSFDSVKKCVSSNTVLSHFSQSMPIGIACDASSVGLGVVLFHKYPDGSEKPSLRVQTLSSAENNYSQIEKVGLCSVLNALCSFYLKTFLIDKRS